MPDPASVGQHLADVAVGLRRRGRRVVVLTSARGYDDPSRRYPAREQRDGVEVRRLPLASFGKGSMLLRLAGAASFLLQALVRGIFTRGLAGVLVSTSPPMAALAALGISALRRSPICFWVVDVNPDQAVALGQMPPACLAVRAFEVLNRAALRRARTVVTLDRFMAERLEGKAHVGGRLAVLPPWPHNDPRRTPSRDENPFRREHGLDGRLVFLYSGNLSQAHPLTTLIEAAWRVRDLERVVFLFVGSGSARREVAAAIAAGIGNVRALPYQPVERLDRSLAAGDVHLVTFGDPMAGIVHPSKVYGAMAAARPVLLVGPERCSAADLVRRHEIGWIHRHGDVDGVERTVRAAAAADAGELEAMGARARAAAAPFAKAALCPRFCDLVVDALPVRDAGMMTVRRPARERPATSPSGRSPARPVPRCRAGRRRLPGSGRRRSDARRERSGAETN